MIWNKARMYVFTLPIQYDTKGKKGNWKQKQKTLHIRKQKGKKYLSAYTMVVYIENIKSICIK